MTIIESLHDYINRYEPLQDDRIHVDFLPEDAGSYSLDVVPCKEWVKQYLGGGGVKQFLFSLSSREVLDETLRQQMDNIGFYEDFSGWLYQQTMVGDLPDLGEGRTARTLEALSSGYVFQQGANTAKYQIQCRLTYTQEKGECKNVGNSVTE